MPDGEARAAVRVDLLATPVTGLVHDPTFHSSSRPASPSRSRRGGNVVVEVRAVLVKRLA
jgi:hypothetical protein